VGPSPSAARTRSRRAGARRSLAPQRAQTRFPAPTPGSLPMAPVVRPVISAAASALSASVLRPEVTTSRGQDTNTIGQFACGTTRPSWSCPTTRRGPHQRRTAAAAAPSGIFSAGSAVTWPSRTRKACACDVCFRVPDEADPGRAPPGPRNTPQAWGNVRPPTLAERCLSMIPRPPRSRALAGMPFAALESAPWAEPRSSSSTTRS